MREPKHGKLPNLFGVVLVFAVVELATADANATEPKSTSPIVSSIADALLAEIIPSGRGSLCDFPDKHDPRKPLVVLVPGLLAADNSMNSIRDALCSESFGTSFFTYSSHEGIVSGANLLSKELRRVGTQWPNRNVVLLTHSMGGLVARACVEDKNLNPGNISRLIMIAPPNHGSAIAGLSAAELAKKFSLPNEVALASLKPIDDAIGGFVGRIKEELRPESSVLAALNSNPIPGQISYSIIAGTGGPVPGELIEMSLVLGRLIFGEEPEAKTSLNRVSQLARLDEWTRGRGDGVVSVKSAKLAGVTDIVELPFGHNDFGTETTEVTKQVITEVLNRLRPERK